MGNEGQTPSGVRVRDRKPAQSDAVVNRVLDAAEALFFARGRLSAWTTSATVPGSR